MLQDLLNIFYPESCICCTQQLYYHERRICDECRFQLPRTYFERKVDNPVKALFYGKVDITLATAHFAFKPKTRVQKLIHAFKYHGKKNLAFELGREMGKSLKSTHDFLAVSHIIPVPLHPKKLKKRGYNQAELIAQGIAEEMERVLVPDALIRKSHTSTQTNKSSYERWQNVDSMFEVKAPEAIDSRHCLLVDDVITTGATLESCAQSILKVPATEVSIATLAWAEH